MIKRKIFPTWLLVLSLFSLCLFGLTACQAEIDDSPTQAETLSSQAEQPTQSDQQSSSSSDTQDDSQGDPQGSSPGEAITPTSPPEETELDPVAIEAAWRSSAHADAFVVDSAGQNNTCAQCHAPINWQPSMDTLPESCFTCKFELEDPPPFIAESEWLDIPCNVCHKVDKKDVVQPEYAWLEIAPLGEYTAVASPSELCLKCHAPIDIAGHGDVKLGGAHADYECTGCHSAHATTTSCASLDCHPEVIDPTTSIPGHDADHQVISCVACHDGSGMEVGPDEELGLWTTFTVEMAGDSPEKFAFTSHNTVLEAECDRCHFVDNPWALSVDIESP